MHIDRHWQCASSHEHKWKAIRQGQYKQYGSNTAGPAIDRCQRESEKVTIAKCRACKTWHGTENGKPFLPLSQWRWWKYSKSKLKAKSVQHRQTGSRSDLVHLPSGQIEQWKTIFDWTASVLRVPIKRLIAAREAIRSIGANRTRGILNSAASSLQFVLTGWLPPPLFAFLDFS